MNLKKMAYLGTAVLILALATGALAQSEMVKWDGSQWKNLTQELKVAYILGIGNMASFEIAMGGPVRAPCISKAFVDELKSKTVGQVVADVDKFYQDKPAKLKTPVIEVILDRCTKICAVEPPVPVKK